MPDQTALCEPDVARVATAAPFAHVAIETASGPHVTPVLFSADAGRVWFVVARDTLKARVLAKRPRAAVLLDDGERSVLVRGDVRLLDPLRPLSWARAPVEFASAPFGLQSLALRNPREMLGFALDTIETRGAPLGSGVLLAALDPESIDVVPAPSASVAVDPHTHGAEIPRGLPRAVTRLPRSDGEAIVAWLTPDGPVAVPARWDSTASVALVAPAAARTAGLRGSAPACIAFDAADRKRPSGKRGVMLRGEGRAHRRRGATVVSLETNRATWWNGFETGTVKRTRQGSDPVKRTRHALSA